MSKVKLRPNSCDILEGIGAALGVMYLVLGLSFAIIFILVNRGIISNTEHVVTLDHSYTLLVFTLLIIFIGFLSSILLISGAETENSFLLLPWLVFHLLVVILLFVGGTALLLNFIINYKQFNRAAVCSVPIMTGSLFMFIWMKVYQEMFLIKNRARRRKTQGNGNCNNSYNHPYFAFHPELYPCHVTSTTNQARNIRPSSHINEKEKAFPYYSQTGISDGQEAFKSVAMPQPSYLFGAHLGMLTWKSSPRRFETIEASILFEEEEEEEEEDKYTKEDNEQPKQRKHYIPGQDGIYIIDCE